MTLRTRVALIVVVVVAVVVGAVGNRVHAAAEAELIAEVDQALVERSEAFRDLLRRPGVRELFTNDGIRGGIGLDDTSNAGGFVGQGRLRVQALLTQATRTQVATQILTVDGASITATTDSFSADVELGSLGPAAVTSTGNLADGTSARVVSLAVNDVVVQIAQPIDDIERSLAQLGRRILVIWALATAAAGAVAYAVSAAAVGPIRRLTFAAESVATTGDLNQPVDGSGGDEVGRLAASFNKMLAALSLSRQQQHRLVMDASHELRTPLASLRTNVDVLRSRGDLAPEVRQAIVDDIDAEVDELGLLVAELVELATAARDDEEPVTVDLLNLVQPVAERQSRRTGNPVAYDVGQRSMVSVQADGVGRALRNVFENAAKYSPAGSTITVFVDGGRIVIADQGPGIPLSERDAVFDRFHRLEATRTQPGSGLGLAIVRDIVERNEGTVRIEAANGGGAAVVIEFPTTG